MVCGGVWWFVVVCGGVWCKSSVGYNCYIIGIKI